MTETGEPDWALIRDRYEAGEGTVREIAEAFGVGLDVINRRKALEIWRPRRMGGRKGQRRAVINRLMHLLERQIALLELKLRTSEVFDMGDTKIIETITKTFEKLDEMQDSQNKAETASTGRLDPELEAVRARLIERVRALDVE